MQFNFIEIILLLGIVQGLLLVFALSRITDRNKSANSILSIILLLATLMLVGRVSFGYYLSFSTIKWISFADTTIFLFGPLNYLYIKRLITKYDTSYKLNIRHFIPALIHFSVFLYLAFFENTVDLYESGNILIIWNGVEFFGLISNFSYLIISYLLLKEYRTQENYKLSYKQGFHRFLLFFLGGVFLLLSIWLLSYLNYYYLNSFFKYISYQAVWIIIPLFIYIVGYYSLKQPELFRIPQPSIKKSSVKRLSELQVSALKKNLDQVLTSEKIYLKNDLSLNELSKRIDSSAQHISWLLNNEYECSFYDFINKYRVEEFLKRIDSGEHVRHTLLSIAMDVGFNTKSTFNRAFKAHVNTTPSNYIKELKIKLEFIKK